MHKDLANQEGIEKLKSLIDASNICMFTSNLTHLPLSTRPMGTLEVDDEGNLWFFSQEASNKNFEIKEDERVQLFYSNHSSAEYLSVSGHATVVKDEEKAKKLWSGMMKAWFHDGVDDPSLTMIKVTPDDVYYWDTKNNKMVSLIKIAVGALTGKTMDDGVEGNINI